MTLAFVLSTGRAGSTLVSRILGEHPDVLSISEYFAALQGILRRKPYPEHEMDGEELWRILSAPDPFADALIRHGMRTPEMFYPYRTGRFRAESGIPILCHSTLASISDDPDALFDMLAEQVPNWPRRAAADQHRALFAFLAELLNRRVVVERSGGSLLLADILPRQFPEARFVYLHRDGPDTALSMSRFPMFRLSAVAHQAALQAGLPGYAAMADIQAAMPPAFSGLLSPPYDMSRLADADIDVAYFGDTWSDMTCHGMSALAALPGERWTMLRYEDLLSDPDAELARLAGHIGVSAPAEWLRAARRMVDPGRAGKARDLDPRTRARLAASCAPGERAVRRRSGVLPGHGQAAQGSDQRALRVAEFFWASAETKRGEAGHNPPQGEPQLQPRQRGADAEVRAGSKGQVRVG